MPTHVTGRHDVKYWCTQFVFDIDKEDLSNYQKPNFSLPENLYNAYYNSHCIWMKIFIYNINADLSLHHKIKKP